MKKRIGCIIGCLWYVFSFFPFLSYIRETPGAVNVFALMRLLASMCSNVDVQGTHLDEGFAAAIITYVRPFVCVNAVVPVHARLALETLLAASV